MREMIKEGKNGYVHLPEQVDDSDWLNCFVHGEKGIVVSCHGAAKGLLGCLISS